MAEGKDHMATSAASIVLEDLTTAAGGKFPSGDTARRARDDFLWRTRRNSSQEHISYRTEALPLLFFLHHEEMFLSTYAQSIVSCVVCLVHVNRLLTGPPP